MSKVKRFYAPGLDCLYRSDVDAPRQLIALVLGSDYDALAAKLAMAEDAAAKGDAARQQCGGMEMEIEELRAELAELRARVVVVPGRLGTTTSLGLMDVMTRHHHLGWNACLDELARLNGMTVSEGLVQGMAKFAQEIICGALEGGSFDGADIQESAERHGLIAKQVMNEPCRGPEEYCACAWSTSFPAECYRVTPKLRALLNEDKENGDHAA
ncbi:phage tail assembly chaperone [Pseudomonas aeruginosa]|uniref:phage tail assembly chaperone n=1 Tax=Pseudomonas aeruginosa TaxID=287 RepID=UPI001F241E4C|nr:phage tail assembly chaperone [Pseudomonas aeruginosa]